MGSEPSKEEVTQQQQPENEWAGRVSTVADHGIPNFRGELLAADHPDYDGRPSRVERRGGPATPTDRPLHRDSRRGRGRCHFQHTVADLGVGKYGARWSHNIAGTAVCDVGSSHRYLGNTQGLRFDPAERTARVQGGALWSDVDHLETQAHGLGHHRRGHRGPAPASAGVSLGGGIELRLMRKHRAHRGQPRGGQGRHAAEGDIVAPRRPTITRTFSRALRRQRQQLRGCQLVPIRGLHPVGSHGHRQFRSSGQPGQRSMSCSFYRGFHGQSASDELGTVVQLAQSAAAGQSVTRSHFRPAIAVCVLLRRARE